jgi:tetratricopeptide (TPR) repeat protein
MAERTTTGPAPGRTATGGGTEPPARPQPIGAFPLPAGFLLVPPGPDTEPARRDLVAGRLPRTWPAALRAHELAFAGDTDGALAHLAGDDPVTRYNRFVIDPDADDPAALRQALGEPYGVLADVVAFTVGRAPEPPALGGADGEVAALVLAAQASRAVGLLEQAAGHVPEEAAPLAGVLLGSAATIRKDTEGATPEVIAALERALRLVDGTDLRIGRAELHLALGLALHHRAAEDPAATGRAVPHYHAALQLVTCAEAPQVWAAAHANLGAAYLTMPMRQASDRLRVAVAMRSLRAALTVYTRETHPAEWASTQLNLANALVYAPSSHQADNLVEAVELYEEVLAVRDRRADPAGRARVLANQGNALAHLGMFDPAAEKLAEAEALFTECGEAEAARTVRELLDGVTRQAAVARAGG